MYMKTKDRLSSGKIINIGVLFLALSALFIFMSSSISGNDFWWHIKVGEYVCETKSVPRSDIFSWYGIENNISWTAHEWLGDVILYAVFSLGGESSIYLFCVTAALVLNLLIWLEVKKYINNKLICSFFVLLCFSVTSSLFFYGRPQLFGFFFVYAEIKILYRFLQNSKSKGIYFIPLIAVLWSNIYGGSSNLSYVLCLLILISSLFDFNFGEIIGKKLDKRALSILFIVTIFTAAAIVVNPIGLKVLTYPYTNLSDSLSMATISEWKAPDAKLFGNVILFFAPIALSVVGFIQSEKKILFTDLLLMMGFVFLFLRSVRFIMLWYIVAAFVCFKYFPNGPKIDTESAKSKLIFSIFSMICAIPLCIGIISVTETCKNESIITSVLDDETITVVKESDPQRIFNDYNLGEVLIYNDIPVFFDARADLFSECGILSDGLELMSLQPISDTAKQWIDVDSLINKYQFDYILINKNRPLYSYLHSDPSSYHVLYENETIGYFKVLRE